MSFSVSLDLSAFDAAINAAATAAEEAARPAAQAGAEVFYREAKSNVERIRRKTGKLADAIYQAFSQDNSGQGRATYHVSWNAKKAPHGYLVEFGHLQRYEVVRDELGRFFPAVRAGMEGQRRPSRRASQAVKDAYYVTLPTPIQIPGKAFLRSATVRAPQAYEAMQARWIEELTKRGALK